MDRKKLYGDYSIIKRGVREALCHTAQYHVQHRKKNTIKTKPGLT